MTLCDVQTQIIAYSSGPAPPTARFWGGCISDADLTEDEMEEDDDDDDDDLKSATSADNGGGTPPTSTRVFAAAHVSPVFEPALPPAPEKPSGYPSDIDVTFGAGWRAAAKKVGYQWVKLSFPRCPIEPDFELLVSFARSLSKIRNIDDQRAYDAGLAAEYFLAVRNYYASLTLAPAASSASRGESSVDPALLGLSALSLPRQEFMVLSMMLAHMTEDLVKVYRSGLFVASGDPFGYPEEAFRYTLCQGTQHYAMGIIIGGFRMARFDSLRLKYGPVIVHILNSTCSVQTLSIMVVPGMRPGKPPSATLSALPLEGGEDSGSDYSPKKDAEKIADNPIQGVTGMALELKDLEAMSLEKKGWMHLGLWVELFKAHSTLCPLGVGVFDGSELPQGTVPRPD
eukprot:gene9624-biopygen5834